MKKITYLIAFIALQLNAQANWQPIPNATFNIGLHRFDDVFFLNDNLGWAANGASASVYKTTDGGLTWTEQLSHEDLGNGYYFRNIEFLNASIGFLGTLNGTFFKTVDGGATWSTVTIDPNPAAICGLDTVGTTTVYGCGAYFTPAHIIKSTDSGMTWEYIDMSAYANALVEVLFIDEQTGFAAGRNNSGGTILKTTDGGATWTELFNTNVQGEYVWKLQILESNPNFIFGSVDSFVPNLGKLLKSTDAGQTWSVFEAPEANIQAVGFISETQGWMGGHNTGFHETLDGGYTWTNLNIGSNLNRIFIINSNLAYACGTSIYKFTEDDLNAPPVIEANNPPLQIDLSKNPVDLNLEFTITFNTNNNLLITLYDTNGHYITQLSRDIITSPTIRSYTFPVDALASGVYYLDFHSNTGHTSVKFIKK